MPLDGCERLALCDDHLRERVRSEMGLAPHGIRYEDRLAGLGEDV
jgi:hypothetical protein